jgi:hypothetical protein
MFGNRDSADRLSVALSRESEINLEGESGWRHLESFDRLRSGSGRVGHHWKYELLEPSHICCEWHSTSAAPPPPGVIILLYGNEISPKWFTVKMILAGAVIGVLVVFGVLADAGPVADASDGSVHASDDQKREALCGDGTFEVGYLVFEAPTTTVA